MKKGTINYLNKNIQGYCHDHWGAWAVCNTIAMLLPEDYVEDKTVKELSHNFMTNLVLDDFSNYKNFKEGSFIWPDLKTSKTLYVTCYTEDDFRYQNYRYNNQLIRLFDYNSANFMINLESGFLYIYDKIDKLIGLILPIKIKKEGEKE